ncbi:chemotaxis protein MotB [Paenibacillus baekrokdamisoli]|uniref:Chemotaxis protein MotB n=1 Tax=Paenibacillus baekrokdamisoli TaxID=1712516 RepID=A0A3G9JG34_9BACL|nr:flagellar motor protein MotB [Paenibacillus baekrokdamisoli]MBB3073318.1 chemotaxis protein MotB [Paenibacillus baekrokdamisoli]BBH23943.1 chemotaxis protein MotB [Paenibacillus baekrokdamisoli]
MRRRSRKKPAAPESHERWLITYADLITLLMIFFVILYAMSRIDTQKYEVLAQSLQLEFRKSDTVIEMGSGVTGSLDRAQQPKPAETSEKVDKPDKEKLQEEAKRQMEQNLQDLLKVIQSYIKQNHLENKIFVADTSEGIAIRLSDQFLFDLGKANLKDNALPVLGKLASLFSTLHNTISIEGHTDNLAIQPGGVFQDNWELSAGRSLSVLRYFVDKAKIDPKKFKIAGYGDTRPVVPNTTNANRQKNRRVEITVLRSLDFK